MDASASESCVPVSSQAKPRPNVCTFNLCSCKKTWLTKVSEKDAFFFCYAARLLSIFIFKTSLVFSIISFGKVILQK